MPAQSSRGAHRLVRTCAELGNRALEVVDTGSEPVEAGLVLATPDPIWSTGRESRVTHPPHTERTGLTLADYTSLKANSCPS